MMKAEKYYFLKYKSQIMEVGQSMGSGLAGFQMKGVLAGASFASSRNYLALGWGGVSPGSVRLQIPKN